MSTDFVGESRKEFAARRGRERLSEIQRVRLKTTVVEINMATESFPARHWNHGVELSLLSGLSDSNAIHHRYFRSAEALSREVSEACLLERAGARLIDMVVPSAEQAQTNIHICMARADMADIHRDEMELRPDAIGPEVLRRLRLGLDVSGCDYAAARRWLAQWRRDLREMFKEVDLLLTPTTRIVAPLRKASADMVETTQALARFYRQHRMRRAAGAYAALRPWRGWYADWSATGG